MQGHGGSKRPNGQGGGADGVIHGGQVPIIGQQQIQIDVGATDEDLQVILAAGKVSVMPALPMVLAIQTLREVRKLSAEILSEVAEVSAAVERLQQETR